jgi:hypothetical protein
MEYALIIIGGLIGGLLTPQRLKAIVVGAVLASCYVAAVTSYAAALGYDITTTASFLLLRKSVPVHEPGLGGLIVGAGIWVFGVLVAAVRLLFSRRSASNRASHAVPPNSALVSDACERRFRAFFTAAQRER